MRTKGAIVSDHLKNSLGLKRISVGKKHLEIKVIPLQSENEVITNFSEENFPIIDFYPIAISLYNASVDDVFKAYEEITPRYNGEDHLTYVHKVQRVIAQKTYDFLAFETHLYMSSHVDIVKKNVEDTVYFVDSDFFKPIKDVLFFLINNYGYKVTDVYKMHSDEVYYIALNEAIIRSDVLTFSLLIRTFNISLGDEEEEEKVNLLSSLISAFVDNATFVPAEKIRGQLAEHFAKFEIDVPIPDFTPTGVVVKNGGRAEIKDESTINSLADFKKKVNEIKKAEETKN